MVYITKFRANDLNPSKGKQIEFSAGIVEKFFGFNQNECIVSIKCLSLSDSNFEKKITATLRPSPARGDYKIYQNDDGSKDLKDVFLSDLHLTAQNNIDDFYAIKKKSESEYVLYFVSKDLLFSAFFPSIKDDQLLMGDSVEVKEVAKIHGQEDELPKHVDMLLVALKLFASMRYEEEWQKNVVKDSFLDVYEFDKMTAEQYAAMPIEQFKAGVLDKVWAFQNGGARTWAQLDDAEKATYQKFVAEMRGGLKPFEAYFPPDKACPRGMGVGVVSEMLMRFYPTACCSYNKDLIWDALLVLGLCEGEFDWPRKASVYQDFMGKCAAVLRRMEEMKFGRTPKEGDKYPPDYITVNEFFWFVHDYKDLIKEEVMKNEFKPVETTPKTGSRKLNDAVKNDEMMQRLMSALRTKPFAILAGHSGTGKSQLVRRLAYMTCNDEVLAKETEKFNAPGNYCMVQVKPNWHDSTDLLGYYTEMGGGHYHTTEFVEFICKAYAYPNTPFFVCLDEMNLAPVEQYFAEFLSAIESYSDKTKLTDSIINENAPAEEVCGRTKLAESYNHVKEHKLTIPRNLFVVGTVNVDETTCQFSRKVLDRAMTLLMTTVSFESMTKENDPSNEELIDPDGIKFFLDRPTQATLVKGQMDWLTKVQQQVGDTAFAIAYRFANECALYQKAHQKLMGQKDDANDADAQKTAIDHAVLMKLLPRIHGTRAEVEGIFKGRESEPKKDGLNKALGAGQSATMMENILKRGGDYISFWP